MAYSFRRYRQIHFMLMKDLRSGKHFRWLPVTSRDCCERSLNEPAMVKVVVKKAPYPIRDKALGSLVRHYIARCLRLNHSRSVAILHLRHILPRKLWYLIVAMLVLIQGDFISHFNTVWQRICKHPAHDWIGGFQGGICFYGSTGFNRIQHALGNELIVYFCCRLHWFLRLGWLHPVSKVIPLLHFIALGWFGWVLP